MEGRGASNVDVPILFFNNFKEFQAIMLEIKNQQVIMTAFMEEMKQQFQSILENFRERGNQGRKLLISLKGNFLKISGGSIMRTYENLVNFTTHLCRQRLYTFLPVEERLVLWRTY